MASKRSADGNARIAVDAGLAVVYVAVMATALVQEAPHEFLGLALFALAVAHVVLNRRWFTALACFGAWSFFALGLPAYLTGRVQFAFADRDAPLALTFAQYASVAVLVAGAFYYLGRLLRGRRSSIDERGEQ